MYFWQEAVNRRDRLKNTLAGMSHEMFSMKSLVMLRKQLLSFFLFLLEFRLSVRLKEKSNYI